MKNYAKVGNKKGRPAYRTPATFRYRQYLKVKRINTDTIFNRKLRISNG